MTGRSIAFLAWPEVENLISSGAVAVLPIGAAAKEHGLHLPMMSDLLQAEFLAGRLAENENILIWPTLSYGYYPAFVEYPGSCTLELATFERVVEEITENIFRSGATALLLLNTGISTIAPLDSIAGRSPAAVKPVHVYRGSRYLEAERHLCRQSRGGHGDEAETSIMLAIAPDLVRIELAKPWLSTTIGPGTLERDDSSHPNFSPDGIYGDPTLATCGKGVKLLDAMIDDLKDALKLL